MSEIPAAHYLGDVAVPEGGNLYLDATLPDKRTLRISVFEQSSGALSVQVDTTPETGVICVLLNDAPIYEGDPEWNDSLEIEALRKVRELADRLYWEAKKR